MKSLDTGSGDKFISPARTGKEKEVEMVENEARSNWTWPFIVFEHFLGLLVRGRWVALVARGLPAAVGAVIFGWLVLATSEIGGWIVVLSILAAVTSFFPGMGCYVAWRSTKYGFLFVLMNIFWGFHVAASWFPFLHGLNQVGFFDQILQFLATNF